MYSLCALTSVKSAWVSNHLTFFFTVNSTSETFFNFILSTFFAHVKNFEQFRPWIFWTEKFYRKISTTIRVNKVLFTYKKVTWHILFIFVASAITHHVTPQSVIWNEVALEKSSRKTENFTLNGCLLVRNLRRNL